MFHPSIHINLKPVPHHHIRSYQKLLAREDTIATMENIMMKEYAATGLGCSNNVAHYVRGCSNNRGASCP